MYNKQCQFTMNNNIVLIYYLVFSTFLLKRHNILFASSTLRKSKCKSLIIIKRNKLEFERKETCPLRPIRFEIFFYKMILCQTKTYFLFVKNEQYFTHISVIVYNFNDKLAMKIDHRRQKSKHITSYLKKNILKKVTLWLGSFHD